MNRTSSPAAGASFLALAAVGFLASAPAFAADAPKTDGTDADGDKDQDKRSDIIVTGQHQEELQGPKATAKVVDTPRSVVIIPKDIIEQTGSTTLADALRTVPGITFGAAEGGNPIGDRPFIRGFDSQGSVFVDGVRDPASQTRETFDVEQVQIVRGSDSTLGGRGSAGGSINVISKLPVQGNFVTASASYGTADYKRITGDANYMLTDTIGVRLAAMWHDQDVAGRDAIWQKRWGFAPSVTIGLGTDTRLTASYYYLETHELPDSGLPFLYTIGNAPGTGNIYTTPALGTITTMGGQTGTVDRSTFYGLVDRDFRDTSTDQATLRVEHDFGGITLRNTSRYSHNYQQYSFLLPDDSQGNVYGTATSNPTTGAAGARGDILTGGYVWRRSNNRYGYAESIVNQTDLYGTFNTGSVKHSFAAGTEFSWEKTRRGAYVMATGSTVSPRCNTSTISRYYCTSLFNPNPNDPWVNYASDTSNVVTPITKGAPNTETQNDAHTIAVYAFDSITLTPSLILNLGLRYDHFESTVTPPFAAGASAVKLSRTDDLFNWQAGLVFKPTPETSIYASYATAATPPNALLGEGREDNALPTTPTAQNLALLDSLRVQKTKSYEVGAKASLFREQLALGLALFQTDIDNARATASDGTVEFIGQTRIRGIEFTANGQIVKGWTVFGGYTHLDPKIVDGGYTVIAGLGPVVSVNTGKQVPQTATDTFTLWTTVEPIHGLSIGGGAFYSSRVFGGYADNRSATVPVATRTLYRMVPSYWRFDARIAYKIDKHWEVSANVQNLTDETYFNQVYTSHYASIAPGRSAFASVSFKY